MQNAKTLFGKGWLRHSMMLKIILTLMADICNENKHKPVQQKRSKWHNSLFSLKRFEKKSGTLIIKKGFKKIFTCIKNKSLELA